MAFATGIAFGLQACQAGLLTGNERGGIVEHVTGMTEAAAFKIADDHCHKFGRVARVSGLDVVFNRLMFDCVAP